MNNCINTNNNISKESTSSSSHSIASSGSGNSNNQNVNKQIKIGNYLLGTTIGKGNSAVVKIATHSITRQKVAIKMFDKSGLDNDKQLRLRREIDSMKRLRHQNIIRLYEIMETTKLICIVTEYASNGELYDYIIRKKRLSEREARYIFKQIVAAVHYCHVNHIVHRDIKVENILLDTYWHVKLADFGFSNTYKPGELLDIWCGSPQYCAPELYLAQLYDGPKVDIWSLGVVLYVLVCGYLPFEAQVFSVLRSQVISGSYKIPFFLSEDCKSLINGMLTIDPMKRYTMNDIINHKWLQSDHDCGGIIVSNLISNPSLVNSSMNSSEISMYQEFRSLVDKIEQISIKEFELDENVLIELTKYGLNIQEVVKSVRNNEFDSNSGIYYLIEAKLIGNGQISINQQTNNNSSNLKASNQSIHFNNSATNNNNNVETKLTNLNAPQQTELLNTNTSTNNNSLHTKTNLNYKLNINLVNSSNIIFKLNESNQNLNENLNENDKMRIDFNDFNNSSQVTIRTEECNGGLVINEPNDDEKETTSDESNLVQDNDGMLIEELGRDYLYRYNAIRRHTIGTNADNDRDNQGNNLIKSTECLLMLNETDSSDILCGSNANTAIHTNHTISSTPQPMPLLNFDSNYSLSENEEMTNNVNKYSTPSNDSINRVNLDEYYSSSSSCGSGSGGGGGIIHNLKSLYNKENPNEDKQTNQLFIKNFQLKLSSAASPTSSTTPTTPTPTTNSTHSIKSDDKHQNLLTQNNQTIGDCLPNNSLSQNLASNKNYNNIYNNNSNGNTNQLIYNNQNNVNNRHLNYLHNNHHHHNHHHHHHHHNHNHNHNHSHHNQNLNLQQNYSNHNYRTTRSKHNRSILGSQHPHQQHQHQPQHQLHLQLQQQSLLQPEQNVMGNSGQYLFPPSFNGRRASDGGSNITLFNQFYSLKNVYCNNPNNSNSVNKTSTENTKKLDREDSTSNNGNNGNSINQFMNTSSYQSRGSITSGIPIFSTSTQLLNASSAASPNSNFNSGACISSEDEDSNLNNNSASSNNSNSGSSSNSSSSCNGSSKKHQKKSSRTRHEPYVMDTLSTSSINLALNTNLTGLGISSQLSPQFKSRQRELSFSGTNSPPISQSSMDRYNSRNHRGSEPNPLELIYANRAHLERIYNQSISKPSVPPTKELFILQQENPSIDEQTQIKWQNQHRNLMINLTQLYSSKENSKDNTNNTNSVNNNENESNNIATNSINNSNHNLTSISPSSNGILITNLQSSNKTHQPTSSLLLSAANLSPNNGVYNSSSLQSLQQQLGQFISSSSSSSSSNNENSFDLIKPSSPISSIMESFSNDQDNIHHTSSMLGNNPNNNNNNNNELVVQENDNNNNNNNNKLFNLISLTNNLTSQQSVVQQSAVPLAVGSGPAFISLINTETSTSSPSSSSSNISNSNNNSTSTNITNSANSNQSSTLQMIQEEQNEMSMLSSASSSLSSSASTTPRMNRSILSINRSSFNQPFSFDNEENLLSILKNPINIKSSGGGGCGVVGGSGGYSCSGSTSSNNSAGSGSGGGYIDGSIGMSDDLSFKLSQNQNESLIENSNNLTRKKHFLNQTTTTTTTLPCLERLANNLFPNLTTSSLSSSSSCQPQELTLITNHHPSQHHLFNKTNNYSSTCLQLNNIHNPNSLIENDHVDDDAALHILKTSNAKSSDLLDSNNNNNNTNNHNNNKSSSSSLFKISTGSNNESK